MRDQPRVFSDMGLAEQWKNLSALNPEEKTVIQRSRREGNAFNLGIASALSGPVFLAFCACIASGLLIDPGDPLRPHYIIFFGSAAAISFIYLIRLRLTRAMAGAGAYAGAILAVVVLLNLVGMYRTGDRSIYFLAMMVCALLFSAPLVWYIVAFSAAWAASVLGMIVWLRGGNAVNDGIVLAAITAVSIATALVVEIRRSMNVILAHRLRDKNQELQEISLHDPLTGLYNRRFLLEWLRQATAGAAREASPRSLILAVIDLDRLKAINDGAGHTAGDEALKTAATVLRTRLRKADIIARYGGDEIIAAMPNTTIPKARLGIERCMTALRSTAIPSWPEPLTFSCGLAAWKTGMDENALIAAADERLYSAKRLGRDRVVSEDSDG